MIASAAILLVGEPDVGNHILPGCAIRNRVTGQGGRERRIPESGIDGRTVPKLLALGFDGRRDAREHRVGILLGDGTGADRWFLRYWMGKN